MCEFRADVQESVTFSRTLRRQGCDESRKVGITFPFKARFKYDVLYMPVYSTRIIFQTGLCRVSTCH